MLGRSRSSRIHIGHSDSPPLHNHEVISPLIFGKLEGTRGWVICITIYDFRNGPMQI